MTNLLAALDAAVRSAREAARSGDGRFGIQAREEARLATLRPADGSGYLDESGRFVLGEDGECPDCGHLQPPGSPCEICDPSCLECLGPRQDYDASLCDDCTDRAEEQIDAEDVYEYDDYRQEAV